MRLSELNFREGRDIPDIFETENSSPGIPAANLGIPAAHLGIPAANFLGLFMDFMNKLFLYLLTIIHEFYEQPLHEIHEYSDLNALFMKSMNMNPEHS